MEGLIESIPMVGYRVKHISDAEAVEIWEIRNLIECLAVGKTPKKENK
jgi:DNA-binding GntR family transcriptional regulator